MDNSYNCKAIGVKFYLSQHFKQQYAKKSKTDKPEFEVIVLNFEAFALKQNHG